MGPSAWLCGGGASFRIAGDTGRNGADSSRLSMGERGGQCVLLDVDGETVGRSPERKSANAGALDLIECLVGCHDASAGKF